MTTSNTLKIALMSFSYSTVLWGLLYVYLAAIGRFYRETKFLLSMSTHLESQNQAKNISLALPSFPIKIWGKSVLGFLSYDRTNKQTRQTEIVFIYIDTCITRETHYANSSQKKVDPLNLKYQTKQRTFLWFSRVPQSKCEVNRSRGSWAMISNIQTDKKQSLQLYISRR